MPRFRGLANKENGHVQAVEEGARTSRQVSEWLGARGYKGHTTARVGQFLPLLVGKRLRRENRGWHAPDCYFYYLL